MGKSKIQTKPKHITRTWIQFNFKKISKSGKKKRDRYLPTSAAAARQPAAVDKMNLLDEALMSSFSAGENCVVLIEDCVETSGDFLLHQLIKRALSSINSDSKILLLGFAEPFSHYDRVLKKLGCNLVAHKENGRFHFFDLLRLDLQGECKDAIEDGLMSLYSKVEEVASSTTIVIDDLCLLEIAAHGSTDSVLNFLHYCITLASEQDCTLVILTHEDIYTSGESAGLLQNIYYLADIILKTEPLATGLASDVHGQLTVINKDTSRIREHSMKRNHGFHFRVKENGVEFFYPGAQA